MNSTINSVHDNTMNLKVRSYTKTIIANMGKMMRCEFVKKDGSVREMYFIPRNAWNEQNGIETTVQGRAMIETKCGKNMITVCEFLGDGKFQPRTINLEKVLSLEVC